MKIEFALLILIILLIIILLTNDIFLSTIGATIILSIFLLMSTMSTKSEGLNINLMKNGGKDSRKLYFLLSTADDIDFRKAAADQLIKSGWSPVANPAKFSRDVADVNSIDLAYGIKGTKLLYQTHAKIKNFIGKVKRCIADKYILAMNIAKISPRDNYIIDHFSPTVDLQEFKAADLSPGQIKIVKPSGTSFHSGKGIIIVTNQEDLAAAKKEYPPGRINNIKTADNNMEVINATISDYISKPMTFDGLKMHLRMYMLVTTHPKPKYSLFHEGKVLTAASPYKAADWSNTNIHDTHERSTKEFYTFQKDYERFKPSITSKEKEDIFGQMNSICGVLYLILASAMKDDPENVVYDKDECRYAFEVFGVDFMIDESGRVYLIEVNDKVGYDYTGAEGGREKFRAFLKEYFKWLYDEAIAPLEQYL